MRSTMAHRAQPWHEPADHVCVSLPSVRIPLLCLAALLAVLAVAAVAAVAPAADAKGKSRGTPCAASAGALRPSPLRACVRVRKAPKALPSLVVKRDVAPRAKRRRAVETSVSYMMG